MGKKLKECAQMNGNVNWTEVKRKKKHYTKSNKVTLQISNDRKSNNNL